MRILILGINYWPEETGIAPFTTGRAEHLAALGHDVTVVTGFPYYPKWRVAERYRGALVQREERAGVRILRSWLYVPRRVNVLSRIVHEGSFLASATLRALGAGTRPDVLLVVSPPLSLAVAAIALGRAWRRPFVFHVEDLQPDAAIDLGMLPNGTLMRTLRMLERCAYRKAAVVTTLNGAMRNRIIEKGIAPAKVAIAAHWCDPELFTIADLSSGARRDGKFVALHAGNIGVKQGLGVILDAAALTRERDDLVYLLVGDGAMRPMLERRIAAERRANVRMLPLQPRERFRDLLAAAQIALVTQQRAVADIVFPSKVETFLAAGRPVVASVNAKSTVARVLCESRAGEVVEPENPEALSDAIISLMREPSRRDEMSRRGREYARDNWAPGRALDGFAAIVANARESQRADAPYPTAQPARSGGR
jgi:colanic acid biosynthesis glycosyl transferase WcaI